MHILNYKIATRYLQQQKRKTKYLLLWVSAFYKYFQNFDYIRGFTYELASIQPKKTNMADVEHNPSKRKIWVQLKRLDLDEQGKLYILHTHLFEWNLKNKKTMTTNHKNLVVIA